MLMSDTLHSPPAGSPAPDPVPPRARRRRIGRWLLLALLAIALLLAALAGGVLWSLRSAPGSAWLLSQLPNVKLTGARGTVLGDFEAEKVEVQLPGVGNRLLLSGVRWRGLRVDRLTAAGRYGGAWLRIVIDELQAARVDVQTTPDPKAPPLRAPTDLRLPFELEVARLRVTELHAATLGDKPMRELQVHLHLGAEAGALHRVDKLSLAWDRLRAEGSAHIATTGELPLQAMLKLRQDATSDTSTDGPTDGAAAWLAEATLTGPLARPALQARVRRPADTTKAEQSLDVQATLRPFSAWPLGDLRASTRALDLSAFSSSAPVTALSGQAVAASSGFDQPAQISIDLGNTEAGRWNDGKLPLRGLKLELRARPNDPRTLDLQTAVAELGTAQQPAGRITGSGHWTPQQWQLDATLSGLQPSRLDARAAEMQLSGPLTLAGRDFDIAERRALDITAELTGAVQRRGPASAVQLVIDASATAQRVDIRKFIASAGGAKASASGVLQRADERAPWQAKGQATLLDFDPLPWWSGPADSPWRKGPHRLNGKAEVDVLLAAPVFDGRLAWGERLAALQGRADLTIARGSVLAGVPLSGDTSLRHSGSGPLQTVLKLDAAGNTLNASGSLVTGQAAAHADRWTLAVAAPALDRLAPLWRLLQTPGADATLAGAINATARLSGRWPLLTTEGQMDASGLRVGRTRIQQAQARWQAGTSADAPIDAQGSLTQVGLGNTLLDTAQWQLKGSGRAHSASLRVESKALPPAWTEALQPRNGAAPAAGAGRSVASLSAQGGLIDVSGTAAGGWRGTLQQVEVRSGAAVENAPPNAAVLLRTRDVGLDVQWGGDATRVTLQPGRAELLGAALRWSRIAWQAAAQGALNAARLDAEVELEAVPIAPLLARLQPDFGWGGDLAVVGHISLRSGPAFSADVVFERAHGDLTVTDEIGVQALGLTDLRLGLDVKDGTWSFTQALAGKTVGVAAGAVVARTSPQAMWPPADTPLSGVLEVQVANLGTWGNWVPAGWRLNGALRTSASIGGRFGAPEYTGEVRGTGLGVRNFLQGVNVSDGDVLIALQGATARIEHFTAKAGTGTLRLEGNAVLGEKPTAQLKLSTDQFQVLGRVDRRIVASGDAQLQLDASTLSLDGSFRVDEGLIDFSRSDAPELSGDVVVTRPTPKPVDPTAPTAVPDSKRNRAVAVNLRVDLGQRLRLRGRGLDTGLQGDLRVTSPNGRMAVNGSVRAVDGTYAAYGQKLVIDRGSISFNGPVENPRLDIEATRPNTDLRVGVAISGSAQNPRIRLFSEPEVSDIDKLSWLVLGRASDGLGRTDTALLQRAALALLAGEGEGLTDPFTKALGLDQVSLRQTDGETRETIISLGKQLSRRWYVGYERGLNSTNGTWQLIYRIAQRFTLRAQSGQEDSLDLIWIFRWQ